MLRKLFFLIILFILIANFCWNGKPLYKQFISGKISTNSITNKIKTETHKTVEKTKKLIKKGTNSVKSIKKSLPKEEDVSKKDKEELNNIIKKHVKH